MEKAYWITKDELVKIAMKHKNVIMIIAKDGCHMVDKKNVFFIEGRFKNERPSAH